MQALESARLSLAEFRLRSGFADPRESLKQTKKDVADALRTVFWAFSIQAKTGLPSPRSLERHFQPETFRRNEKREPFNNNKWRNYFAGRHVPTAMCEMVEAKYAGSRACLNSPLWAALTPRQLTRRQLEELVLPLAPDIQAIVRRRGTEPRPTRSPGMRIDRRLAEALERRTSFDALAAAVVMLRIAHIEGETAAAYQWGSCVLRIMVMLGELLIAGGIARPLLELMEERLLPMAQHDGARPGFPPDSYALVVGRYGQALRRIKEHPFALMTEAQRHEYGQRILNCKYGFDYFYALNPVRMPVAHDAGWEGASVATPGIWLRTWALNMLRLGGHATSPPSAVRSGHDLWAAKEGTVAYETIKVLTAAHPGTALDWAASDMEIDPVEELLRA